MGVYSIEDVARREGKLVTKASSHWDEAVVVLGRATVPSVEDIWRDLFERDAVVDIVKGFKLFLLGYVRPKCFERSTVANVRESPLGKVPIDQRETDSVGRDVVTEEFTLKDKLQDQEHVEVNVISRLSL